MFACSAKSEVPKLEDGWNGLTLDPPKPVGCGWRADGCWPLLPAKVDDEKAEEPVFWLFEPKAELGPLELEKEKEGAEAPVFDEDTADGAADAPKDGSEPAVLLGRPFGCAPFV